MSSPGRRVAVVGGGWAGVAAAVEAVSQGHQVTLFETAAQLGGRARSVDSAGRLLDNGQHILIGAYRDTLQLIRRVGVDVDAALLRQPLRLQYPDGSGLCLPAGRPVPAFVRGVLRYRGWPWAARGAVLLQAGAWLAQGFRCPAHLTVERLVHRLPRVVRDELIEPLCVAALNTPAARASAQVFLRVLKDALFGGPGCADLLLPRVPLRHLLPQPAGAWLQSRGAELRLGERVQSLLADGAQWRLNGHCFDAVVLACTAAEAARLTAAVAPGWSAAAGGFEYEPIVTVYLACEGARLPQPMTALRTGPQAPAQFLFDHGALGGPAGQFACVVSGAREWVAQGLAACAEAAVAQALSAFPAGTWPATPRVVATWAEKRATFLCSPQLERPGSQVARGLIAAGDYIEGPYPATLEGAVRSGLAAARQLAP
ncbi:hydroxysqualene dehydroxylase HpnE [Ideonella sp. BN130291]|uniref:hydroxysqualene dehydroxylase HpnE n=1 Tax=Ideonella sp. BN130291 TaxID=3112940 RepID=UPI002E268318|nr:hydroxysqualene dehydroxylase HpnE [Ideonella sp. BN130291]